MAVDAAFNTKSAFNWPEHSRGGLNNVDLKERQMDY